MSQMAKGTAAEQLIRFARLVLPRGLRNILRAPLRSIEWVKDALAFRMGTKSKVSIWKDWEISCHPATVKTYKVFLEEEEFRQEMAGFQRYAATGMVLLDIGAHYGSFSLAATHFGGPTAKVIAIDPSPRANRMHSINLGLNGLESQVRIMQMAVGQEPGRMAMLTSGFATENQMVCVDEVRSDVIWVERTTLAALVAQGPVPTHLKVDVEGFEEEVFRGGLDYLATSHPVIFLELHNTLIRNRGKDPRAVLGLLQELGYHRFEHRGKSLTAEQAVQMDVARLVCLAK